MRKSACHPRKGQKAEVRGRCAYTRNRWRGIRPLSAARIDDALMDHRGSCLQGIRCLVRDKRLTLTDVTGEVDRRS
ncbi:hypothetical protein ACS0PU_005559 [Formica fusca]